MVVVVLIGQADAPSRLVASIKGVVVVGDHGGGGGGGGESVVVWWELGVWLLQMQACARVGLHRRHGRRRPMS